jgi:hypothetical protein
VFISFSSSLLANSVSQLSLSQFRDDPRSIESFVKQPNAEFKKQFPVFSHRLALARITHRFCRMGMDGSPNATSFANVVDKLHSSMASWKESLPVTICPWSHHESLLTCLQIGYQPEQDIFADSDEYQVVLLMHVEYYNLMLAMFTALGAASRLLPKDESYSSHPSAKVRNQIAIRISNARRLLHTIGTIADTSHLKPCVSSW